MGIWDVDVHVARIATEGWTVLEDVIEPDLVDEIGEGLLRLERDLGVVPANNLFEGLRTTRIYNLLVHGPLYERIPVHPPCCRSSRRSSTRDC